MNGFHLYSCKHTTFCMQDKCYQCDKISPNTQPRLRDINATRFFRKHNLKEPEITHTHRVEQNYDMDLVYSFCNILYS